MKRWLIRAGCAGGSGALLFLACADFDIWPLGWVGFLPLLLVLRAGGVTPRRAFFWGWLCGIVANAGGFYWITNLLMRFGHMPWLPATALFLLLAAYQGLHWGLFAYIVRRVTLRQPELPMTLLAPVTMTAMELIMPFIFPWYLAITQAWIVPVIQVAELTGPLGVTFLMMLTNGMLYDVVASRLDGRPLFARRRPLVIGAAVVAAALVFGFVRIAQIDGRRAGSPKVKIGVVQANIGIVEKGRAALAPKHLAIHLDVSRQLERRGAELILWPESSYPYAFERGMKTDWPSSHPYRVMRGLEVPLIFGTITYKRGNKYPWNSALMMEPDGRITGRFDKNYLLIFGEYIPFYEHIPSFKKWFPAASHFNRGEEVTVFKFRDWRIGPLICYEDIIPSFGRRLAVHDPNLLINVTNDAWFGRTSEPWEHMALSVYRAVELRVDLVRAVNTGVSAFIDANGRLGRHTQSYDPVVQPDAPPLGLLGEVAMMERGGKTLYAALGDWLGWLCLLGVAALFFWPRRQGEKEQAGSKGKPGKGRPGKRKPGKKGRKRG